MKPPDIKTHEQLLADDLANDPEFRAEWERNALARAVALQLVEYRAKHGLTQAALARQLGMVQSAIGRLEQADHNPSIETLRRLAKGLGIDFHIDITPERIALSA